MINYCKKLGLALIATFFAMGTAFAASSGAPNTIGAAQQQGSSCNGVITDEHGEPVVGATVHVERTSKATVTDLSGKFSLAGVEKGAVLTVSYVGYEPISVTYEGNPVSVSFKDNKNALDELVVVGFGVQKKVNLTGAVSQVKMSDALGNRPLTTATEALQGAIPGLRIDSSTGAPGTEMSYNIRGITSINGGGPLVLVNNVPMDINLIDPQDIETVSVLKDAASAAIYGARAAFGVILITTKTGQKDSTPRINYNNNFAFSNPAELPNKVSPLETVMAARRIFSNGIYVDGKNLDEWEKYILDYNANPSKYPDGYVFDEKGNLYLMRNNNAFEDMMDNFGFRHSHNASISGGSKRVTYRTSVGYSNEDGIIITDKDSYKRVNLSQYLNVDVTKWLSASVDVRYNNSKQSIIERGGRSGVWGSAAVRPSYHANTPFEVDGVTYLPECSATYVKMSEPRHMNISDLRIMGKVEIRPVDGLKLTAEYTFDRNTGKNSLYANKYQYLGINFNGIANSVDNSFLEITRSENNYNALNLYANYDKTFGKHSVHAMVGFNQEDSRYESQYSKKMDILVESLPSLSGATGTATTNDSYESYALRSAFFRLGYDFAGKYMVEFNGRYDGTSRFPKKDRFGFFPSFSAGWRISEEKFMESTRKVLNNLKIRFSYGSIGNQILYNSDGSVNNYPYIPSMTTGLTTWLVNGQKPTTMWAPKMVSATLTWEKVNTIDVGVDFALFSNRLTGSFDWYQRDTKDMLAPGKDLPWVVGTTAADQNAADLRTRGWEIELGWNDRIGKDWRYGIAFNLSDSKSKITRFENATKLLTTYYEGMDLNEIWGFESVRLFTKDDFNADGTLKEGLAAYQGQKANPGDMMYRDLDDDGKIYIGNNTADNPGDRKVIGNSTPRFLYGARLSVGFKGFDLSIFLRGVGKRDYWRTDQMAWPDGAWDTQYKETLDFWGEDNLNAKYPRVYEQNAGNTSFNKQVQTRYLADASFLKLQNITLTYTLPQLFVNKCFLTNASIFISGENLYTWHKLSKGMDPEMVSRGAWNYPFMRKISFGINITL